MSPPHLRLLFSREHIAERVQELAAAINRDYPDGDILLVGVLKGSFLLVADLARALGRPCLIDFVRLASYGNETSSSGLVEIRKDLELPIHDRDVLIVEDIVDTGLTLEVLYRHLLQRRPRSLKVCALLDKRCHRQTAIEADYVGIRLEEGFVVGYGLDFQERYRHLPEIYLLEPDG